MHLRRKLGPPDWTIFFLQVFLLAIVIGALYGAGVWGISKKWKPVEPSTSSGYGFVGLMTRHDDGSLALRTGSFERLKEMIAVSGDPPTSRVFVNYTVSESVEARAWDLWSASLRRQSIIFYANQASALASGTPPTPGEQLRILRELQQQEHVTLPPLLKHATKLSASVTITSSAWHNATRAVATALAIALFAFGVWRIILGERRLRRWYTSRCERCGYTLADIRGDRCPECGTRWHPYGEDISKH